MKIEFKERLEMFFWKRGLNFSHYEISRNRIVVYGKNYNTIAEYDLKAVEGLINEKAN